MNLDDLLDELKPVALDELEDSETHAPPLSESLSHMITLADRMAKTGYRASKSTEHVGQTVDELRTFVEEEVKAREEDLRRARSTIGDLEEERDRLVQCLMEVADLSDSAADAANDTDGEVSSRFERLHSHVLKVLHRAGVEPVAEAGDSFNPEYHEAIDRVSDEAADARTIVQVVRQGYRYGGETVRVARVIVAE